MKNLLKYLAFGILGLLGLVMVVMVGYIVFNMIYTLAQGPSHDFFVENLVLLGVGAVIWAVVYLSHYYQDEED